MGTFWATGTAFATGMRHNAPEETVTCSVCGLDVKTAAGDLFARHGKTAGGDSVCLECMTRVEGEWLANMPEGARFCLYLSDRRGRPAEVTNWLGTVRYPVASYRYGQHNMARSRWDVWFTLPSGRRVWGVNIGDNQILRCRVLKG